MALPMHFDGEEIRRCPRRPMLDAPGLIIPAIQAYSWRNKGWLPSDGSWRDQDALFVQICDVIDAANHDAEDDLNKRRQKAAAAVNKSSGKSAPKSRGKQAWR